MTTTSEVPNETQASDESLDSAPEVDKTGQRIQKMFGEISGRYDFLNHFLSCCVDIYWRWRTVRRVRPNTDAPLLDVCTGTGDLAIAFWKKARRELPVVGTDFTHEMLVIAREKAGKLVGPNSTAAPIEFLEADTLTLPFDADSFQIVSVAFGLRNVANTLDGLREMTRVCQPGGQVAVLEFSMPTNRLFGAVYRWYFRNILPRIGQLLARNQEAAYNYLPQSVSQFPQGEELCGMMHDAGLADVTFTPLTFGIATLYVGTKPSPQ